MAWKTVLTFLPSVRNGAGSGAERDMPEPVTGEPIQRGDRHIRLRGIRYYQPEHDRNPARQLS